MASALALLEAQAKYGVAEGTKVWESFRSQNDPEANTTVHNGATFPYGIDRPEPGRPRDARPRLGHPGAARDRPNRLGRPAKQGASPRAATASSRPNKAQGKESLKGIFDAGSSPKASARRACRTPCWSPAQHTETGNPIAVYGPQTGVLRTATPAPPGTPGPGRQLARRRLRRAELLHADRPRRRLLLERHLAPARTSPTRTPYRCASPVAVRRPRTRRTTCSAVTACRSRSSSGTTRGTPASARRNRPARTRWSRSGRSTASSRHRGTVAGKPVLFTKNRSTYGNEAGSALGFMLFNDPDAIHSAQRLPDGRDEHRLHVQLVLHRQDSIAYYNSGDNPVRAARRRPEPADLEHVRVAGLEPGHQPGDVHPAGAASAGGQPGLPDQLEQQAGAGLLGGRRQLRLQLGLPQPAARRPDQGRDRVRAEVHPRQAGRGDGVGRDGRPARRPGAAVPAAGPEERADHRPGRRRRDREVDRPGRPPAAIARSPSEAVEDLRPRGSDPDPRRLVAVARTGPVPDRSDRSCTTRWCTPRRSTSGRVRRARRSRTAGGDSSSATCARCSAIRSRRRSRSRTAAAAR